MAAARGGQAETLPAFQRYIAIPLAGALLFLLFLHLGFPYDRLAVRIGDSLARATGMQVRVGSLAPGISLFGPGLRASGVTAITATGSRIDLERLFLRPAWSISWLRLRPALHFDLGGLELANLPLSAALPGASLRGRADVGLELVLGGEAAEGGGRFRASDGSLAVPGLPVPLPFTNFDGDFRFGGENRLELSGVSLAGPLISLGGSGRLGRGESAESAPLALDVEISAQPGLQAPLRAAGIQLSPDGRQRLQLTGTLARPEIRAAASGSSPG